MSKTIRRWPLNADEEENDVVEPYDETEDVKPKNNDW